MQNCLGKLNLIYCLIYLDDLIVFLQTVEEHLHQLHVMFDWLREYNLTLKPSKCSLFKEEINYLAHRVSEQGVWPSNANLKVIAECASPQTYTEIQAFLVLIGHYRQFIKGFAQITQFLVKNDNNPLTYIMTTPNMDATDHWWVGALAKFNFWLEYQKGWDNTVADMLSWITTHLGPEALQSVLDGATLGAIQRAEGEDPAMHEGYQEKEKEVRVAAGWVLVQMHVTNWAAAQKEDPELDTVLHWLEAKKKTDLRTLHGEHASSEEGWIV